MERLYKRLLEDDSIVHRAVGLREGISLVLDAEHGEILLSVVLQRPFTIGSYAHHGAFTQREYRSVHLILPFPFEDDVQFFVGLVGVQESAVLTGGQRLEGQFAPGGADGLPNEDFPTEDIRSHRQFISHHFVPGPYVHGLVILTFGNCLNLFHNSVFY